MVAVEDIRKTHRHDNCPECRSWYPPCRESALLAALDQAERDKTAALARVGELEKRIEPLDRLEREHTEYMDGFQKFIDECAAQMQKARAFLSPPSGEADGGER